MATYAELSTEDKAVVQAFMGLLRPCCGELARTGNHAEVIYTAYFAHAKAILDTLDAGELVPNESGLSGAEALPNELIQDGLMAYIEGLRQLNTQPHRQAYSRAAGPANLIG
jgi:hypothetical protein